MRFLASKGVIAALIVTLFAVLGWLLWRRFTRRAAIRTVRRFRARIDRFKLTRKQYITEALLSDAAIATAVRAHAANQQLPPAAVWRTVRAYVDEIVPVFSVLAYYQFGLALSRAVLTLFWKVDVAHVRRASFVELPRDSIVIHLMNHRSNADYVLAGYALAGQVAISYAVGEWARVFPLESLFKTFGAYFIRRRYREPLYHAVLERYVHLVTRNGVTQGIFPEGGLSRDGRFRPAKVGLLDYVLGVAREPGFAERLYVVPVALNYDRVLEDRSLLRELRVAEGERPPGRFAQSREVTSYVLWNAWRILARRWKRYGQAAVVIGEPVALAPWFARLERAGRGLFTLERHERLGEVQRLVDDVMRRVGEIMPVTPVPLVCAAIQTFDAEFIVEDALLERVREMRDVLLHHARRVSHADEDVKETLERAFALLHLRRVITREGTGYLVLPRGRELISFYANSIAHLLGEFEAAVRARDALPVHAVVDA
ncbi:MAG TPA: 1-acyl-sn-glycerol-3-phosphate acyltransferase [Gemmatimonadaceae bacterium]|uniref:Glycerol-3-phosphate acyltransferase n=1 Tax=uncultured Gemmatimonadetes bacterium Rifle_16ft_4_minimus_37772 TaxID=1665097 RepID=A0A0H4TPX6_9BACT|nr:glycerol-3-phosphate acyltransferase [uncultured Gemmatimonadetes bacterium Rifle_16ft_4_minimus_37772]HLA88955.1 1-acyl-sn-glycerol-3-phosphate acyltransferase [Gemmatimonadaceae bacterium]